MKRNLHEVAEACVLGVLLTGSGLPQEAFRRLAPSQISHPVLRSLYEAARAVYDKGQEVGIFTIGKEYESRHQKRFPLEIAEFAMEGRLGDDHKPFPFSCLWLTHYCQSVIEGHQLRKLNEVGTDIVERSLGSHVHGETLLEEAESLLGALHDRSDAEAGSVGDGLVEASDGLLADDDKMGIQLGFSALDKMISVSVFPGSVVVVGARPSMGKSALGTNMALKCALRKTSTLFVSLEVPKQRVQQNMLLAASNSSREELRQNEAKLIEGLGIIESCRENLHIVSIEDSDSTTKFNPMTLREIIRNYKRSHGLQIVIVDYLQLMGSHEKTNQRQEEVASISKSLKRIAMSEGVVMVAMSQLSRQTENRDGHKPRLSDLRESGAIEQDADVALLLYRESYYGTCPDPRSDTIEVDVAKNRAGDTGVVRIGFDRPAVRMFDIPLYRSRSTSAPSPAPHAYRESPEREDLPF